MEYGERGTDDGGRNKEAVDGLRSAVDCGRLWWRQLPAGGDERERVEKIAGEVRAGGGMGSRDGGRDGWDW